MAAVVAYHLGHLRGGFLGVDVFLVLSGFLVTSLLLAEVQGTTSGEGEPRDSGGKGRIDLLAFWGARLRRLGPAVLVMVPTVLVAARAVRWPTHRLDDLAVDGVATLTWWQNWRQIVTGQSYWDPAPSPFRHAWSLAIEEQAYVLWPLAVAGLVTAAVAVSATLAQRSGRVAEVGASRSAQALVRQAVALMAVGGALSGAALHLWMAHRVGDSDLSRVYLGTDTRVFALLVGCALATTRWGLAGASTNGRRSTVLLDSAALGAGGVLVLMTVTVDVSDPALYRRGGFVVAALAAAVVVAAVAAPGSSRLRAVARASGPASRVPAVVLTYLGLRSYGIYLWSWPIQVLTEHRWPDLSTLVRSSAVVVASLLVAEASYRVVEHPVRRSTGWAAHRSRRRPVFALSLALPVLLLVLVASSATPDPVHEALDTGDALEMGLAAPARPAQSTVAPGGVAPTRGLDVMVIGDSVAFTVGYYKTDDHDPPDGIDWIDNRSVIGCGLLASAGWEYKDGRGRFVPPANGDCVVQAEVEALGLAERPDVVVTFPGAWESYAVRSPDGEVVEPMTDRMAEVLGEALGARAMAAHEVGAAFVVIAWACPGEGTPQERRHPDYIEWVNAMMEGATAASVDVYGVDARFVMPGDESCQGGPTGQPTEAKKGWMADSNHVLDFESGKSMWNRWLGPLLVDLMADQS